MTKKMMATPGQNDPSFTDGYLTDNFAQYDFNTPMMQQYLELKKAYTDCLLLFRLGDFYELFLDDAKIAADVLDITLTARARGKDGKIPMAGVPHHAVSSYLARLVAAGYKVAICDQVSEPTGKGLVDRKVTRIVTPGTVLDEASLDARSNNYLLCLALHAQGKKQQLTAVAVDISTGELLADEFEISQPEASDAATLTTQLQQLLDRFQPSEVLLNPNDQILSDHLAVHHPTVFISRASTWPLSSTSIATQLQEHFGVASITTLGLKARSPLAATVLATIQYVRHTQQATLTHLRHLQSMQVNDYVQLDASTIHTLEILPTTASWAKSGSYTATEDHSLLQLLDTTHTAAGARLLKHWLLQPLQNKKMIQERQEAVAQLLNWPKHVDTHLLFAQVGDIERLLARCAAGTANPRHLLELANALEVTAAIHHQFSTAEHSAHSGMADSASLLKQHWSKLTHVPLKKLGQTISSTIVAEPPIDPQQGGYIQPGVDPELDELTTTIRTNRQWMSTLEQTLRQETGISSLKVRFNKVFGFYIEVSNANLDKIPSDFIRKQTLVNGERYITPEMKQREEVILSAEEKMQVHCLRIFNDLVIKVVKQSSELQQLAHSLATLDCLLCFAGNAERLQLVKPTITTDGKLAISKGRHPMVEHVLETGSFVPNDTILNTSDQQVVLITGPNMAGKSVYMRQVALIVLLAHTGSFVPAESATVSITDRIFVRSGAGDYIAQGLSTFMVEMVETAFILRNMSNKSLVIMDEIGRGTSTYDGISIAQAIATYLVDERSPRPKTLFATHYHELQSLATTHPAIHNYHLAITGDEHQPVFLYTLQPGGASSSFGIAVARLAGLPTAVTNQASIFLQELESHHPHPSEPRPQPQPQSPHLANRISSIPLEQTTPLEALTILAELQKELRQPR